MQEAVGASGAVVFSLSLLYGFGQIFRRLIGSIYISEDGEHVRISHLTFFGNRQESYFKKDSILPLKDSNGDVSDIFLRVSFFDETSGSVVKESLYLSLRSGGILDKEKFENIFGST